MNRMLADIMTRLTTSPVASFRPESEFFAVDKRFADNCRAIRGYFARIINDKK